MKPLIELTNTEKGRLLADLFPDEIENILKAILNQCQYLQDHEQTIKATWGKGFITAEFWCRLATDTAQLIHKHRYSMIKSAKVFSDQLFYAHTAIYTIDCIIRYAVDDHGNEKFRTTVSLLFDSGGLPCKID